MSLGQPCCDQHGTRSPARAGDLVLLPIAADPVSRHKGLKEMIIEVLNHPGGVSAAAGEGGGLLVDQAVITSAITRLEDLLKMIDHQFVVEFREAT